MNSLIESLNLWGARFLDFAAPMLWQSGLLIAVVFALDFLLRRKIRAAVRYSLWFVGIRETGGAADTGVADGCGVVVARKAGAGGGGDTCEDNDCSI